VTIIPLRYPITIYQLDTGERHWIESTARRKNRLTLAVMLKFFQLEKHFPENIQQISPMMIACLSAALSTTDAYLAEFDWNSEMAKRFQRVVRRYLSFRSPTVADRESLICWLTANILESAPTIEQCLAHANVWLHSNGIEPISSPTLERVVRSALHQYEQRLQIYITNALTAHTKELLETLINNNDDDDVTENNETPERIRIRHLKNDLRGTKIAYLQQANVLLEYLQKLPLPMEALEKIPRSWLQRYALRASIEVPSQLTDHPEHTRHALMVSFCFMRLEALTDQMTTISLKMIRKLETSAEGYVTRKITAEVKRVGGKYDILHKMAKASLRQPDGIIKNVIYSEVNEEILKNIATELDCRGGWFQHHVHMKMRSLYSHSRRRALFTGLSLLKIDTHHPEFADLIKALRFICDHHDESDPAWTPEKLPFLNTLPEYWLERIIKKDSIGRESVCHKSFEMAVFETLYSPLRSKAMWVHNSWRYRHPHKDLPTDFANRRDHYFDLLDLPKDRKKFITTLKEKMTKLLTELNDAIPGNSKIKILDKNNGHIKLSPFAAQEDVVFLPALHQEIQRRWASVSLLDILKETDHRTGLCDLFHTVGHHENMDSEELRRRLLLALYAIGSNTGFKRMCTANMAVTENDLHYVKRRHIHADNIRAAIRQVINSILAERNKEMWPEVTGCACDSTLLTSWEQNMLAEWHGRYRKHGVMIYWHVDQKSTCIYSQLKTCTSSEVAAMIKGVLHHLTDMDMKEGYVDTHGKSIVGFAICHLLNFDLLPRFKSVARQKLCGTSTDDKKKYPHLAAIMKGSIDWDLIEQHYDEMVQHIAALKTGTVDADVLINRFSKDNGVDPVYHALIELGKAVKTIFLCRYLLSEELRIEINESLNVVERLNGVMDFIFFGKLGEMATNSIDDMELSVLCLHLLQVSMVYINTLLIQEVLSDPAWRNRMTPTDWRAMSAMIHAHINPYGIFQLDMMARLTIGKNAVNDMKTRRSVEEVA
jgi:TnpA family transposase